MHPLIERHREEIEALCRRYGVRRLDVFGSLVRDDFDAATSDVDIVVDFQQAAPGDGLRQYFAPQGSAGARLRAARGSG